MVVRVLPEARDDLRQVVRHYRAIRPAALGKELATRVLDAFKRAVHGVEPMPLSRPEHPDIAGARWVLLDHFPYMAFYAVADGDVVVVAVEYSSRDYAERVARRVRSGGS